MRGAAGSRGGACPQRRGGPEIHAECRELRAGRYRDGLPAGQAVATTAGRLPARWVIHTVGPAYSASEDRSAILASCYPESLRVAGELGAGTVAFPAMPVGIYGWPADSAARIAVTTVRQAGAFSAAAGEAPERAISEVRFVLFTQDIYAAFERALAAAGR